MKKLQELIIIHYTNELLLYIYYIYFVIYRVEEMLVLPNSILSPTLAARCGP